MELEFSIDSDKCFNYQEVYFSLPILSHIKLYRLFGESIQSEATKSLFWELIGPDKATNPPHRGGLCDTIVTQKLYLPGQVWNVTIYLFASDLLIEMT